MPLPVTNAIVITPGDFGDPGLGSQPMATLAGQRIAIDPANAHLAFEAARDAMHANGGSAWVAPGTAKYVFGSKVDLGTRPMDWSFSSGAKFGYASGVSGLFLVRRPTRFTGLIVEQDVVASPTGQSIIEITDQAASQVAVDQELVRCKFSLRAMSSTIRDMVCVRATGFSAADLSARLILDLCTVELRSGGTQQSWSWVGEETSGAGTNAISGVPYGLGLLSAKFWRDVLVYGAVIRGQSQGGSAQFAGVPIILEDCLYADVAGMTVSDLSLASVGSLGVGLVSRSVDNEGSHMNMRGGTWSRLTLDAVAACNKPKWFMGQGIIGRDIASASAMFKSRGDGDGLLLKGNIAHKVGGASGRFADVEDASWFVASGNAIVDRPNDLDAFRTVNCRNVHVHDNLVETRR